MRKEGKAGTPGGRRSNFTIWGYFTLHSDALNYVFYNLWQFMETKMKMYFHDFMI